MEMREEKAKRDARASCKNGFPLFRRRANSSTVYSDVRAGGDRSSTGRRFSRTGFQAAEGAGRLGQTRGGRLRMSSEPDR